MILSISYSSFYPNGRNALILGAKRRQLSTIVQNKGLILKQLYIVITSPKRSLYIIKEYSPQRQSKNLGALQCLYRAIISSKSLYLLKLQPNSWIYCFLNGLLLYISPITMVQIQPLSLYKDQLPLSNRSTIDKRQYLRLKVIFLLVYEAKGG